MALIHCPSCGNEVSEKAAQCPHCGTLVREELKKRDITKLEKEIRDNTPKKESKLSKL